jgi:hypothetical protein
VTDFCEDCQARTGPACNANDRRGVSTGAQESVGQLLAGAGAALCGRGAASGCVPALSEEAKR